MHCSYCLVPVPSLRGEPVTDGKAIVHAFCSAECREWFFAFGADLLAQAGGVGTKRAMVTAVAVIQSIERVEQLKGKT